MNYFSGFSLCWTKLGMLVGLAGICTLSLATAEETRAQGDQFCEPPMYPSSPFEGEPRGFKTIANKCESAYPRDEDVSVQTSWETAVARRCQSEFAQKAGTAEAPTYKEACLKSEERFQSGKRFWSSAAGNVTMRTPEPICAQAFTKTPEGEQYYSCSVYYSTTVRNKPTIELNGDEIFIGPR